MTIARLEAVGFCAHYSQQGDWAFDFAVELARRNSLQLNVFHFLTDPYQWTGEAVEPLQPEVREQRIIELERELRLYYDERLGDFLEAGFRLCEDREWTELHKCLMKREFQVLVLACPETESRFAGKTIEDFAGSFVCPVVLVGPNSPTELRLNQPAALIAERLGLASRAAGTDNPEIPVIEAIAASAPSKQLGW